MYGSSQAAIQIILDAEESYGVLTGSNVIRAVTGETLTNYEIGGGRVMGQWTGTVDLVARDRIDLLSRIRRIHELFSDSGARGPITKEPGEFHEDPGDSPSPPLPGRGLPPSLPEFPCRGADNSVHRGLAPVCPTSCVTRT